jgi:hypothetical protein
MARGAFAAPLIEYVDLREIVRGSPSQQGTWDRAPDPTVLKERAQAVGLTRALWCAMQLLTHFFPEAREPAGVLTPELPVTVRALLEAGVVLPSRRIERTRINRATEEIVKLVL